MSVRFEVEQVALIAIDLPVVMVRLLDAVDFSVEEGATLGGCVIAQFLGIPASVRADGSPRLDVFAFALAASIDLERFKRGDVVLLRPAA
jgi:hypothetical protein